MPSAIKTRPTNNKLRVAVGALTLSLAGMSGYIAHEGGVKLDAYIPIKGDVPTIAAGSTVRPDGTKVQLGDKITPEQAKEYIRYDVNRFSQAMNKCFDKNVKLTQNEWDAYFSLLVNVGEGAVCSGSIPELLKTEQYDKACLKILDYNKMRDCSKPKVWNQRKQKWECPLVVIKGLDNRRKEEYKLCIKP